MNIKFGLIKGSKKDSYEVEIEIDQFNDTGLKDVRCTCPHFMFRQEQCKHIDECLKILKDFGVETDIINKANLGGKDELD